MIDEQSKKYKEESELQLKLNARLCAVILNANGAKKENGSSFSMEDFLGQDENVPQNPELYSLLLKRMNTAMGGREIHRR